MGLAEGGLFPLTADPLKVRTNEDWAGKASADESWDL